MPEPESVGNAIRGNLAGSAVQASTIQQVVLHSATPPDALPVPRQLPGAVPDFTGRDNELAALDRLLTPTTNVLGSTSVAVIDGTGGAGKTTLLVHWAHRVQHRFPDGTLFINLRGYGPYAPLTPAVVLASFLPSLGVAEARIPSELDAQVGLYRSILAGRRVLVILDNATDAEQVRPLLPGLPECMAVVTSRASLTELVIAEAAQRVSLSPFTVSESQQLLRRVLGSDRVNAEVDAVTELVQVCAGLPLALRVAATRVAVRPHLDIADIVADINNDQPDHNEPGIGFGEIGAAMQAVFDSSYHRLPADAARVFRRLGLHPSPEFGVDAAAALTGLSRVAVYRHLEVLAEFHLVELAGRRRYRMHNLLHDYAARRARLDDSKQEQQQALCRVVTWYARAAQTADQVAFSSYPMLNLELAKVGEDLVIVDWPHAMEWLITEQINLAAALRAAAEHKLYEPTIVLAASSRFHIRQPRPMWTTKLEAETLGVAAAVTSGHQTAEVFLRQSRGDTLDKLQRWEEAEAEFVRILNSDHSDSWSGLVGLGKLHLEQNRLDLARKYYLQAKPLTQQVKAVRFEAVVECNLARIAIELGEYDQALAHAHNELELRRRAGDKSGEGYALTGAARARLGKGDFAVAVELAHQALAIYRTLTNVDEHIAEALEVAASSLERLGQSAQAVECLQEAATLMATSQHPDTEAIRQRARELAKAPDGSNGKDSPS